MKETLNMKRQRYEIRNLPVETREKIIKYIALKKKGIRTVADFISTDPRLKQI